jgi:transcriptional regulator with XRE-family HTH domain
MSQKSRSQSTTATRGKPAPQAASPDLVFTAVAPMLKVAQQLRSWTDGVLGLVGPAGELSLNLAKARTKAPRQLQAIEKAGSLLRVAREGAGMTTKELSKAIDLDDPQLLEQAERGKAALPIEVILRLASVLGRHDPMTFAMKLSRTYNPLLWKALDELGIDRMVALVGREREMANLYRANDDARRLSDADFAAVLSFTRTAFDMGVKFRAEPAVKRGARARKPGAE